MEEYTKTIPDSNGDSHEYAMLPFNALKGRKLFARFVKAAEPIASVALETLANTENVETLRIASGSLKGMLNPVIELVAEDDDFLKELFSCVRRDGEKLTMATIARVYTANYGEFFAAVWWVLEEQFMRPLVKSVTEIGNQESLVTALTAKLSKFTSTQE